MASGFVHEIALWCEIDGGEQQVVKQSELSSYDCLRDGGACWR